MIFNLIDFLFSLAIRLIFLPFGAVLLMFSGKIFKIESANFKNSLKISAILLVISFIFQQIITFVPAGTIVDVLWIVVYLSLIIFSIYLIKKNFSTSLGVAIGVWLVSLIFWVIVIMIIVAIVTILWAFVMPKF